MKIFYIGMKYDYGDPKKGYSFEHYNFYDVLVRMNRGENEVIYFPIDEIARKIGYTRMNQKLSETIEKEKPNLCFFVLLSGFLEKKTIKKVLQKNKTLTFNWFTDDHWAFDSFSKHWTPLFNWVSTTDSDAFLKYEKIGYKNVIKTQWGCNHFLYKPLNLPKIYDVTFVGQTHGDRRQIIRKLKKAGIKVECFGNGWPRGRVSQIEMIKIFCQSKINLNFAKSSGGINIRYIAKIFLKKRIDKLIKIDNPKNWINNIKSLLARKRKQIKGRNFEVTGCRGFLLTDYIKNLEEYYKIGEEIVCYNNIKDLVSKIIYYLNHDEEREAIAKAGYERTLKDNTFEKRFNEIFKTINLTK